MIACWTASKQAERSILHQGHNSRQNSSYKPRLSPAQYSLTRAESWPICINLFPHARVELQRTPYNTQIHCVFRKRKSGNKYTKQAIYIYISSAHGIFSFKMSHHTRRKNLVSYSSLLFLFCIDAIRRSCLILQFDF